MKVIDIYCSGINAIVMCRLTQPLLLGDLIYYFSAGSVTSRSTAFLYAVCIIICSAVNMVVKQAYMLAMFHTGMKMRVGICSLLYRKASTCYCHAHLIVFL
jgi:ATP-binding cassette subfamily C (CFTR/MRP) protein 4